MQQFGPDQQHLRPRRGPDVGYGDGEGGTSVLHCRAVTGGDGQPVDRSDETGHELGGRGAVEHFGHIDLLDPALVHHADAVGDRQRLLLIVGDEERGDADLELQAADLLAQLHANLRVQRR